jgi:hypothetical protein
MLRDYVDRGVLRVGCWAVRRLRARGLGPGQWTRVPDAYDRPVPRPNAWRRSEYWSKEPEPPARPAPWHRVP